MRQIQLFLLTSSLALSNSALSAATTTPEAVTSYAKVKQVVSNKKHIGNQIELLFFQHAKSGRITPSKDNSGCYRIELSGLNKHVVYFADEPHHLTGVLTVPQFLETWYHNQKQYGLRPNSILHADVVGSKKTNQTVNDVAAFSQPQYDSKRGTLSYLACPLTPGKTFTATQLKDVNIFFDPFHRWPP